LFSKRGQGEFRFNVINLRIEASDFAFPFEGKVVREDRMRCPHIEFAFLGQNLGH
jgi:hypothetical protein